MKRIICLTIMLISFSISSFATHVVGGEISWKCLSNGRYVFSMVVFRDCSPTSASYFYDNEALLIRGNPLPANGITSITMRPDSNRWRNNRNGDTSPYCTTQYGEKYTCSNESLGTIQAFYYQSDPIILTGTPPSNGWNFFFEGPCCRSSQIANVNATGRMLLRATMYPGPNGLPADPCFDSSPEFKSLPTSLICRGYEFTYNHTAIDENLDSLDYKLDRPYNLPSASPIPLTYKPGFSPTSPTPGSNLNLNNIALTLDPLTGISKMAVYSGAGIQKYITVIRVDAYRECVKVASVYRELPISLFDCPALPNGQLNKVPQVRINGKPTNSVITEVVAGQRLSIPIQVEDNDVTGVGTQLQNLTLVPDGLLFTSSRGNGTPCQVPGASPCAYLQNRAPQLNSVNAPPTYQIQGVGSISTEFVWQTDCEHIQTNTCHPGRDQSVHNFVMRVFDDHCPIPALNYPTISVRVKDPFPLTEPILKGVSINLDGTTTISWAPPIDSAFGFDHYEAISSRPNDGFQPTAWNNYNNNIRNYTQEKNGLVTTFPVYDFKNPLIPSQGIDLFSEYGNKGGEEYDFYVRMRTLSGCSDTIPSQYSQPVRVMELESSPAGVAPFPARSLAKLTWNRPKPLNSKSYPYYAYESQTHFYIWANDEISSGGIADPNNWYIIGETTGTSFDVGATTCNDYVGFRIEARDSLFVSRHGTTERQLPDSIQRLFFSTFSVVDTIFMEYATYIPPPKFDTLKVTNDGQVFLRIDLKGKRTTSDYNIYEGSIAAANLLASVSADEDSVLLPITGALTTIKNLIIEAVDGCDPSYTSNSGVYNTFIPTGMMGAPCSGEYILNWSEPGGFPSGVVGYKIMVDRGDGKYIQEATINGSSNTTTTIAGIQKSTAYRFQIIAFDSENAVNISAAHVFNSPVDLEKDDVVDSPTPRCTYVNDDGSVTISWIKAIDTVANFGFYDIEHRAIGTSSWNQLTDDDDLKLTDGSYTVSGIDAQKDAYEFRIRTTSGCDGRVPADWEYIKSVFVKATPQVGDPEKRGDVVWNPTGIDYGSNVNMDLHKHKPDGQYENIFYKTAINTNALVDNNNSELCDSTIEYHVLLEDDVFAPGFSCIVRSNLTSAHYLDTIKPVSQNLLYVSFNLLNRGLDAYWGDNAGDVHKISFLTTNGFNSGLQAYKEVISSIPFDTPLGAAIHEVGIPHSVLDSRDSSITLAAQAEDACGNIIDEADLFFHKTMELEVEWDLCDSTNGLNWNPYVGFDPAHTINYEVYYSTSTNEVWTYIETTNDTLFKHLVQLGGRNYKYHVRAFTNENPTFVSNSNIDSVDVSFAKEPNFDYLSYATVLNNSNVELEFYKDIVVPMNGYTVFRGLEKEKLSPIAYISYEDVKNDRRVNYTDIAADVHNSSYFYQIITKNACDIPVASSNIARTIHLSVETDNAELVNVLKWNNYEEWDSAAQFYNVYRGVDGDPSNEIYKVIPANASYKLNTFIDDVYANLFARGKFCYRVEAVQGPINSNVVNGYAHDLEPATSNSNTVCVIVEPLMYIPNAFAPDGINKTFGPKGQFFNYTQFEMSIFNRWGEQIYLTRDLNQGWDGTVNGEIVDLGSYVYMIRFVDANGEEHRKKGSFTLIK